MIKKEIIDIEKFQVTITLILVLSLCITGATFAYFAISESNNNTITGEAATVNLTLTVDKVFPTASSDNTGVIVPQLSTSGSETSPLATALKNGCVDANKNIVCQVYKIVAQNSGGTATQVADGWISFYSDSALTKNAITEIENLKWKLITSANATTPSNSVLGTNADLEANSNKNIFADDIIMPTNSTFTYYVIVWVNETGSEQTLDAGKTYYGKVEFSSSNGTGVTSGFSA